MRSGFSSTISPHADPQWLGGEERGELRVDVFLVKDQGLNVSRTGGV
jgi:hypothetical protein